VGDRSAVVGVIGQVAQQRSATPTRRTATLPAVSCCVDESIGTGGEVIHRRVGQPGAEHGPTRGSALPRSGGEHAPVGAERELALAR